MPTLPDMLLASVFKTYSGFSSRRFTTDVQAVMRKRDGLIDSSPHFNSSNRYIAEVSADKAYSSRANLHAVVAVGATPYIPFVRTATGRTNTKNPRPDNLWSQAWHFYNFHQEEFAAHYHRRSNAETVMAMIKAKFGASVKSKTPTAQVNEVLCKVLAHNICVLIQSFYELGIESTFVPITKPEPKVIDLNQYRAQRGL